MDSNSVLTSILSDLQEKHKLLNQIFEATKALECMSLDDEMSLASFVNIRQTAMNNIDKLDTKIKECLNLLPLVLRDKVPQLISPKEGNVTPDNSLEINISDAHKRNMSLLKKIIEADTRFNKKINHENVEN